MHICLLNSLCRYAEATYLYVMQFRLIATTFHILRTYFDYPHLLFFPQISAVFKKFSGTISSIFCATLRKFLKYNTLRNFQLAFGNLQFHKPRWGVCLLTLINLLDIIYISLELNCLNHSSTLPHLLFLGHTFCKPSVI